jgi:hypothetical protein
MQVSDVLSGSNQALVRWQAVLLLEIICTYSEGLAPRALEISGATILEGMSEKKSTQLNSGKNLKLILIQTLLKAKISIKAKYREYHNRGS